MQIVKAFFISLIMAIGTISEIVYSRVTWLMNTDQTKVDTFICQVQWTLQPYFLKDDTDTEDESTYSSREKLLTGLMTAYNLVSDKIIQNTGGVNGSTPTAPKILKKAKADVTEAEFQIVKESEGGFIIGTATQIKEALKGEICQLSRSMKILLPMCGEIQKLDVADAGVLPFRFACGNTNCC